MVEEISSIMLGRSPPSYDTLTLIAMQGHQTKSKNKTETKHYIIKPGSDLGFIFIFLLSLKPGPSVQSFFVFFLFHWRCGFFRVFLYNYRFSLCMESTSYVFPLRMVFFYLVTTGWIFLHQSAYVRIQSINQSINQCSKSF